MGMTGAGQEELVTHIVPVLYLVFIFFFKENKTCLLTYCLNVCNLGQLVGHAKDSSCFMMCHHC